MERSKQIAAIAESEEERMVLIRACEKLERAMQREVPGTTSFLTPREQALLRTLLPQCAFFGGTEGTDRNVAFYLPEYLTAQDYFDNGPIACIRGSFYEKNALSHRDILGALMGTGIRRDAVGDICVRERDCDVFVLSELAPYLLGNLTGAGRHHLALEQIPLSQAVKPPQQMRESRVTLSSLRLDSIAAAAFHLSRGAAAETIRAGNAAVNGLTCTKPDRAIGEMDEVSLRSKGKLRVLSIDGTTRKGRLGVTVGIYI